MAACAALTALLLCLAPFGAARAAAAAPSGSVHISLDANLPSVSSSGQPVVISGTITNTGSSTIDDPVVHVSINPVRLLDTRSAAQGWMSGTLDLPVTQVATGRTDPVSPGSTTSFAVTIPGKKLKLSYGLAALPLTVTVSDGRTTSASAVRGTARSTLQQQNTTVQSPLQVSVVIPLTLPADPDLFGPSGKARAAAWERAIGPDSRVQRTLDAFTGMPVIFAVDPSLLDPPAASDDNVPAVSETPSPTSSSSSSSSTSDATPSGSATPGTEAPRPTGTDQASSGTATDQPAAGSTDAGSGDTPTTGDTPSTSQSPSSSSSTSRPTTPQGRIDSAVSSLTDRLDSLGESQSVWWLPSDDPDLAGLSSRGALGHDLLQRDLARPLPEAAADISTTRVVWPVGDTAGSVIRRTATTLGARGRHTAVAVLPNRAVAASATPSAIHRSPGTSGVLSYHEELSRIFSASSTSPGTQTNQLLTRLLAVYQQSPGTPRSLALVAPRSGGANPTQLAARVSALQSAAWVHLRSGEHTTAALAATASRKLPAHPRRGHPYPPAAATAVTTEELHELQLSRRRIAALHSVMVGGDDVLPQRTAALDIIGSNRWRGASAKLEAVADRDDTAVTAMLSKLSIRSSTINFFADSGDISVTVSNQLNRPVHGILLRLQPRQLLIKVTDEEQPVDVDALSHATARFHIKAVGGGTVPVDAVLRAPDGAPLGSSDAPSQLKINVHPTSGWIMWMLGVLAALILALGLWRAVRRGPRTASTPTSPDTATPGEAIVDAGPIDAEGTDDTTDRERGTDADE